MFGLLFANATDCDSSATWLSVVGVQVAPASVVFQMPPWLAAASQRLEFVGCTAMPQTCPEYAAVAPFNVKFWGAGPTFVHVSTDVPPSASCSLCRSKSLTICQALR